MSKLHPRNPHQGRYDFSALCRACPELNAFVRENPAGDSTIDFSDPQAVRCLNRALLAQFYGVKFWDIPDNYLCPPIPGRADYVHYAADLLARANKGAVPQGRRVNVLDVGVGANCIYPIIGSQHYGWRFVGSDIDPVAVGVAEQLVRSNKNLSGLIDIRLQNNPRAFFNGVIGEDEYFNLTLCNPPFHASMAEVLASNQRKRSNLSKDKDAKAALNFGGQHSELWCQGGEIRFLKDMAKESVQFAEQVHWFTSLVSKADNVRPLKKLLSQLGAKEIDVINMSQGQKISRLIAWRF